MFISPVKCSLNNSRWHSFVANWRHCMIHHIALMLHVMRDVTYVTIILISTVNDYVIISYMN